MVEATTVALGLLVTFELGFFVKGFIYTVGSHFLRSKVHPLAKTHVWGICSTRDIDFMLNHINNARYLRAMDMGRLDHFTRARFTSVLLKSGGNLLVAASTIRYRKPVYIFMPYRLDTQVVYWDSHNFYYRQDFHTLHDGFLRVTAYVKVAVKGSTPIEVFQANRDMFGLASLAQKTGDEQQTNKEDESSGDKIESPPLPTDLAAWINFNEESSASLKRSQGGGLKSQ